MLYHIHSERQQARLNVLSIINITIIVYII